MAEPAVEDVRELARLLLVAAEQGETRSFASLREELAIGHDDLESALEQLTARGMAAEITPGEWSGPGGDAMFEDRGDDGDGERVVVSVPDASAAADAMRAFDGQQRRPAAMPLYEATGEPTVRLTRAIALALNTDALGQIVKVAIDNADETETFVLEVVP